MTPHTARVVSAAGERMASVTLTEFLLARIAEDEAVAHDADLGTSLHGRVSEIEPCADRERGLTGCVDYDPARVLAECEAKRRIVKLWNAEAYMNEDGDVLGGQGPETHHDVLCALAAVYAGHPDYREEWKP